ncbi:hypothetical protein BN871_IK_00070 [Paenibacillus sp. P22]|nr:hypothetical protein BN871_IK_00070 [Paenibacillus sp. P22]
MGSSAGRRSGRKRNHRAGLRAGHRGPDLGRNQIRGGSRRNGASFMSDRRAVITGIGCVTPIGTGAESLWEGVRRGESAVGPIDRFVPEGLKSRIAAQIKDFRAEDYMDRKRAHRTDRYSQLSIASGRMALRHAGIEAGALDPERTGIFMGSALGGISYAEEQCSQYMAGGYRSVSPTLGFSVFGGASSCNMAMEFGFNGPNETNSMSCASGAVAIGRALQAIRRGEADVMLAGGAESPLSPLSFGAFDLLRAMSTRNDEPGRASRPFDRTRDGFVMGGRGGCARHRGGRPCPRQGSPHSGGDQRLRRDERRPSHERSAPLRNAGPARDEAGAERCGHAAGGGGLHQRPRFFDAAQRRDRIESHPQRIRHPSGGGQRHERAVRPSAWSVGSD